MGKLATVLLFACAVSAFSESETHRTLSWRFSGIHSYCVLHTGTARLYVICLFYTLINCLLLLEAGWLVLLQNEIQTFSCDRLQLLRYFLLKLLALFGLIRVWIERRVAAGNWALAVGVVDQNGGLLFCVLYMYGCRLCLGEVWRFSFDDDLRLFVSIESIFLLFNQMENELLLFLTLHSSYLPWLALAPKQAPHTFVPSIALLLHSYFVIIYYKL